MNPLTRLNGFWRLWIALSILWIVGVYAEDNWSQLECVFRACGEGLYELPDYVLIPDGHPLKADAERQAQQYQKYMELDRKALLLRAFVPPFAVLAMSAVIRWIMGGFKRV